MIAEREPEIEVSGTLGAILAPESVSDEIVRMVGSVQQSVVQVAKQGRGGGAGVIWRDDGAILTNFHVIAGPPGARHESAARSFACSARHGSTAQRSTRARARRSSRR